MPIQNVTNSSINNSSNNVNSVKPNEQTKKQEIEPKKINKKKLACTLAAALGVTALAAAIIFKGKSKGKIEEVITSEAAKLEEAVVPEMEKAQRAFSPEILKLSDEALLDIPKIEKEAQEILTEAEEVRQKGQNIIDEMLQKVKALGEKPSEQNPFIEKEKNAFYGKFGEFNVLDTKENVLYVDDSNNNLAAVWSGFKGKTGEYQQGDKVFYFENGKLLSLEKDAIRNNVESSASKYYNFDYPQCSLAYDENFKHTYSEGIATRAKEIFFNEKTKAITYIKDESITSSDMEFKHCLRFNDDRKLTEYSGILEKQSAK